MYSECHSSATVEDRRREDRRHEHRVFAVENQLANQGSVQVGKGTFLSEVILIIRVFVVHRRMP